MGAAAELVSDLTPMSRVQNLRDRLESGILQTVPATHLNGTSEPTKRLPNTSNLSFENTNGEVILARLNQAGVCVSTGSACNSKDHTASPVLTAMDVPYSLAMGSIRFSLGRLNSEEEVDEVLRLIRQIVGDVRSIG
jgi:cysteine desulfurase